MLNWLRNTINGISSSVSETIGMLCVRFGAFSQVLSGMVSFRHFYLSIRGGSTLTNLAAGASTSAIIMSLDEL